MSCTHTLNGVSTWEIVSQKTERGFRETHRKCTQCFDDDIIRENAYNDHP